MAKTLTITLKTTVNPINMIDTLSYPLCSFAFQEFIYSVNNAQRHNVLQTKVIRRLTFVSAKNKSILVTTNTYMPRRLPNEIHSYIVTASAQHKSVRG